MNLTGPRHVRSESAGGPPAAETPWDDLAPPEPFDDPVPAIRAPTGHRVTQETVDRMAELRRQGATHQDIAARIGCSERTVRRYAGRVERQLVPPPAKIPEDTEAQRAGLVEWYTLLLEHLWDRFPSVALLDEAIRQLVERIRSLRPETVRLLARNRKMQFELFREVVGPLVRDYSTFADVASFMAKFADARPLFWRPEGKWRQVVEDDEARDP